MKILKSLNIELATLVLLVSLMIIYSHGTGLDSRLANYFYNPIDQWIYRDSFVLEKILHKGGVIVTIVILLTLLVRLLYLFKFQKNKNQSEYLSFVFLTSIFTIFTIFLLKRWSTLPCPWDSLVFGGNINPPKLMEAFAVDLPKGKCFPAGHSSGGFCFLSLYFGHTVIYGKRNFRTLIPGVVLGVTFGLTQQMRGAHFLSHDLATILITIAISWITSLIYYNYGKKYEI